ncbi:MAG: bifunctional riboflavin kinase/FAD synthetase [Lachnospiraceae bacterium]|nr:bifunctional riboflavin kinase/FAD synthetase [Lachnospiraceae bacterium]
MQIIDKSFFVDKKIYTVVTVGKFDGIHTGHMKIFDRVMSEKESKYSALAVSFINHPSGVLGNKQVENLLTEEEKVSRLEDIGFELYCQLVFDNEFKNTTAEDFFNKLVVEKWNAKVLVVGDDFCFGKDRQGTTRLLEKMCFDAGVKLIIVDRLKYNNEPVSSSRIKKCLKDGNISEANEMLGYTYTFTGKVESGNKIGRTIGFPTANIYPTDEKCIPEYGVYGSFVEIDGRKYKGITNIGVKPTVSENNKVGVETHIIDFDDDLYGKNIKISLKKFIRGEKRFNSLDELKEQIKSDKKGWTNL